MKTENLIDSMFMELHNINELEDYDERTEKILNLQARVQSELKRSKR